VIARYDGLAEWYDQNLRDFTLTLGTGALERVLGRGPGECLDLGCGTGLHFATLLELGWRVTGVDVSVDQLRVAAGRGDGRVELVRADAAVLPFEDGRFDAVAAVFVHTDFEDYEAALRESARVLRPGGRLVHIGLHPCFVGPFSRYVGPDQPPELHAGYRDTGWTRDGPGLGQGLRRLVGTRHLPLADLLNATIASGLTLEHFEEPGETDYPRVFAFSARR
jgi:SAM-dependent methyltransferase